MLFAQLVLEAASFARAQAPTYVAALHVKHKAQLQSVLATVCVGSLEQHNQHKDEAEQRLVADKQVERAVQQVAREKDLLVQQQAALETEHEALRQQQRQNQPRGEPRPSLSYEASVKLERRESAVKAQKQRLCLKVEQQKERLEAEQRALRKKEAEYAGKKALLEQKKEAERPRRRSLRKGRWWCLLPRKRKARQEKKGGGGQEGTRSVAPKTAAAANKWAVGSD